LGELMVRAPSSLEIPRLWRALVSRSPITELVDRSVAPTFVFSQASMRVLADPVLRSGIARRIAQDTQPAAQAAALGDALLALGDAPPPTALYCALALVYEVHVTTLLGRGGAASSAWTVPTPGGLAFSAVLPAVGASALPFGPAALAPDDRALLTAAARKVRVPRDVMTTLDQLADRASHAGGIA
jgi:hypothetical protein